jgi:hypothetical protein
MPRAPRTEVVTAFVTRGREILVLRRSERVRTYAGRWAAVSGYLESEDPLAPGREPRLGWEHVELKWITPQQLDDLATVPGLGRAWRSVESDHT